MSVALATRFLPGEEGEAATDRDPMHPELATFERAVARMVHDSLVHLVRQRGRAPSMVRVAVPAAWDAVAFAAAVVDTYAARGMDGVEVMTVPTDGEPRLLSVVTRD